MNILLNCVISNGEMKWVPCNIDDWSFIEDRVLPQAGYWGKNVRLVNHMGTEIGRALLYTKYWACDPKDIKEVRINNDLKVELVPYE